SGAYLVAWREAGRIAGLRLDASGVRLDEEPFTITDSSAEPSVTAGATDFAVAWRAIGEATSTLAARRIGLDGRMSEPVEVATADGGGARPTITRIGASFVMAWSSGDGAVSTLHAAELDSNLAPREPVIELTNLASAGAPPAVGWAGTSVEF